ncbi:AAA family ATPase [Devosia sediminis]|uniref:AAA family ATPase n=1 Tax=Devosia sediminis TaxID=2798801 RepID=A0A934IYJ4_9HYPH|nr:AAA family ATPase [Devosia sediminis]MBJ3785591.1 AAA family ATPase [Devosia sediminis]
MTSKDKTGASDGAREHYAARKKSHDVFISGTRPDVDDLLSGAPFMGGDIRIDARSWCQHMLSNAGDLRSYQSMVKAAGCSVNFGRALRALRDSVSLQTIKPVEQAARSVQDDDAVTRMLVYRACLRDEAARNELSKIAASQQYGDSGFTQAQRYAVSIGLVHSYSRQSMFEYHSRGRHWIASQAAVLEDIRLAAAEAEAAAKAKVAEPADRGRLEVLAAVRGVDPDDEDFIRAVMEVRAEFWSPNVREIVVVPAFPEGGTGHRKDLQKGWAGMDGQPLPVVLRGDVASHRRSLVERWPHAADVIDVVLGDLAVREEVKFRPTLFVGPPGSGKSSLARAICDQIGLPSDLYNLAGIADSSLVGTSAQWSTARECVPLQVIKRSKSASVGVIWDEVEKASTGSQNGSPLDAMLPLLEADQAKRFRDLALEAEVDLSFVSHFGTANTIDGIPAPLRDRMRILVMPEPTWEHLGTLSRQIVQRIARERGVDARWFADLAEDEMDLVRQAWPGGSIRQLTRIVTTLIDGRDHLIGRC